MKVLFVYSTDDAQSHAYPLRSPEFIHMGISYISAFLKTSGHDTKLVVLGSELGKKGVNTLTNEVQRFNPGLICFTAVWSQYHFIVKIAEHIKRKFPSIYAIIGGPHTSLSPEEVINGPFDAICISEGELATASLAKQLSSKKTPTGIANLWIKRPDGSVEKNSPRPFIEDLDSLPLPDRGMWNRWIKPQMNSRASVLLGRGCPYGCTYCSNHALRKLSKGKYVRQRSPDAIVAEIEQLSASHTFGDKIYLEVETLTSNVDWTISLCNRLTELNTTRRTPFAFGANYRISHRTNHRQLFAAMKKANFTTINIGLESGSERIRSQVLKRKYSNEDFLEAVSIAREFGLKVVIFNLIGVPEETCEDHLETVRLNQLARPDYVYTSIFIPYPGTELYQICLEKGYIDDEVNARQERSRATVNLPGFSRRQIQMAYLLFEYRIFRDTKPLYLRLMKTAVACIKTDPKAYLLFRKSMQLPVLRNLRARFGRNP
ncbi:MAG: B12-binding domain-containing radical SAM protein [Proteobacteria bacterium]|nr:B12-binding domain-containing radical SAM protein [Pseudomonadota bacterium]